MKLTKGGFLKLLKEGYSVDEIINKDLSLIDGDTTSDTEEVSTSGTSNTHAMAVAGNSIWKASRLSFNEANSALKGNEYQLSDEAMQFLRSKASSPEGGKRIRSILSNSGIMSYELLKRFKHDIEHTYQGDWSLVLNNINSILTSARNGEEVGKSTMADTGMENVYRDEHEKDGITPNVSNEKQIDL